MKLPRVECPGCGRDVAAAPVPGSLTKGALWRHDHPEQRRDADGALVSCASSWETVDLPAGSGQMELDLDQPGPGAGHGDGALALF